MKDSILSILLALRAMEFNGCAIDGYWDHMNEWPGGMHHWFAGMFMWIVWALIIALIGFQPSF